jgi:hypothetical protein
MIEIFDSVKMYNNTLSEKLKDFFLNLREIAMQ